MKYSELQNRVLRKITENVREEVKRGYTRRNFIVWGGWHVKTRTKMHTEVWLGNMEGKDHVEEPGTYGRTILN
jgi:hypothetical protein